MRIAHFVGHSLVRFTPGRIATYWGRYTEHEGRAFSASREGGWHFREPLNPSGFYCLKQASKKIVREFIETADVLHFHDDVYPSTIVKRGIRPRADQVLVYHAHIGNIPAKYFRGARPKFRYDKRVKHAAITNGYGHLFDDDETQNSGRKWGRLPDILDLDHPAYRPETFKRRSKRLRVVYTYSNSREGVKINAKRPRAHRAILESVGGIDLVMVCNRPFEEAMAVKKSADVVIEECFSPYLHLSALEGAAVGKLVLTSFNEATIRETSEAVGAPEEEWPFMKTDERDLAGKLAHIRDNREVLKEWGEKGRRWMLKYYNAPRLLRKYLEFYDA